MKSLLIIISFVVGGLALFSETNTRFRMDYENVFSENSQVTAVFISCSKSQKLQISLRSFLFFNTSPLRKLIVVHCTKKNNQIYLAMPNNFERYPNFVELIFREDSKTMMETLEEVYKDIKTKYIYQSDSQWETVKGYGFIQQSINILQHAQKNNQQYSQVITSFPLIRDIAHLKKMQWTAQGQAFHEVYPFQPEIYQHFTFSPSVFPFDTIFEKTLVGSLTRLGEQNKCVRQKISEYDKCCIWWIGQQLKRRGYVQVYMNDGLDVSNIRLINN